MHELFDPNEPLFWVLVSFIGFMALLGYFNVHKLIGKALDDRADAIRKELDEARRLRGQRHVCGWRPVHGERERHRDLLR